MRPPGCDCVDFVMMVTVWSAVVVTVGGEGGGVMLKSGDGGDECDGSR